MNSTVYILIIIVAIIFLVALIVSVGFLLLVFRMVPAIDQFKSLMTEVEKTTSDARDLTASLKQASEKVNKDLDKVDELLDSTKESVEVVKHSLRFVNKNFLKHSAGLLALIPAIKFGWNLVKKYRGDKNE
jgi:predicted PurR-regulated permease PerM